MDTSNYREWYFQRIKIADEIVANHHYKGEADAEILLCCGISALAAQMWPGEGIDRKRFVQFLIQFAESSLAVQKISVPLLASKLEAVGNLDSAIKVRRTYLPVRSVLLDGDVDKDDTEIMAKFPTLSRKEIRGCAYASSIYADLRSGLVHEFQLPSYLVPYKVSDRTDIPSYVNLQNAVDNPVTGELFVVGETRRYLHFPYEYVRQVSETSANAAFEIWEKQNSRKQAEPQIWWVEG